MRGRSEGREEVRGERGSEGERVIEGGETVLSQQYAYLLHMYIQMYTHTHIGAHTHSTRYMDNALSFMHVVKGG